MQFQIVDKYVSCKKVDEPKVPCLMYSNNPDTGIHYLALFTKIVDNKHGLAGGLIVHNFGKVGRGFETGKYLETFYWPRFAPYDGVIQMRNDVK